MGGKLKVKGNVMLATKLDNVLKAQRVRNSRPFGANIAG